MERKKKFKRHHEGKTMEKKNEIITEAKKERNQQEEK